ncbi:MAG: ABC transporter ATP-binding protein [Sulfurospirillum sp.]|nr:ABC transporter ATP-binding protein [Sulfurospirillum sp.]
MILNLKHIAKNFGEIEVLKDINVDLKEGEILTILGASGSGKSTILNLIAGFEKPDYGSINIYGKDTRQKEPHERNVGFVFQNYALFPHLNVFKNISFGIGKIDISKQTLQVEKLLKLTGLQGCEKRYPHELSGGQQQRVALARTLATNPKLILFDEAFSNVDAILKSKIQKELISIIKRSRVSAVFVTHDSKEALSISDKIAYLKDGKVSQFSTPKDIYNKPSSKSVGHFFGKANFIEKAGKNYCVRPEECIIKKSGKHKGLITNISYHGERQEVELDFKYNEKEYKFITYVDKNFDLTNTKSLNFDIIWKNSNCMDIYTMQP